MEVSDEGYHTVHTDSFPRVSYDYCDRLSERCINRDDYEEKV